MKIGLTQRVLFHKERAYDAIEHGWYSYLKDHTLVFVPNNPDQNFQQLADNLDLLIITGGDSDAIRVVTEIRIATQMLHRNKPIIGVCHGAFLLTELCGGKNGHTTGHIDQQHVVQYNNQSYTVNSYHDQAIIREPKTAQVLCTDSTGNCEAWIDRNIAAVVWHPERMLDPWLPSEIAQLLT